MWCPLARREGGGQVCVIAYTSEEVRLDRLAWQNWPTVAGPMPRAELHAGLATGTWCNLYLDAITPIQTLVPTTQPYLSIET